MMVADEQNSDLATELMAALARNELTVHYQPIYCVDAGRVRGFECLARWHHPRLGMIPPDRFIPIAEATGLIGRLGRFVLTRACEKLTTLPTDIYLSVNISPRQFEDGRLVETIRQTIASNGIDPGRLTVEITENVLLTDTKRNLDMLQQIKGLGVGLSIDDFGTGYSSLRYVEAFMPDKIKIDRSFVGGLSVRRGARAIVKAVLSLARNLDITVTAEGVETIDQFNQLVAEGCQEIQGYFIGRPSPGTDCHGFDPAAAMAVQAVGA